jgi:hypothetical protein
MIEVGPATADEMTLAFLRAEIDPNSSSWAWFAKALAQMRADKASLIDNGDLEDTWQNDTRRALLDVGRQGLLRGFPPDTVWRRVAVTPDEVGRFQYINQDVWIDLSAGTRLVADGARNLDRQQDGKIHSKVAGIAARLRQGDSFQPTIVAQQMGLDKLVLLEGHHRATAYARAALPKEIPLIIGTSAHMSGWRWF